MAKKKLIPFSFMPASWGLKGEAYERAKIEYEKEGLEKKVALAKVGLETVEEQAIAEAEVMFEEGEIDEGQKNKMIAHVKKEPWVDVKKMEVNPDDPKAGYMELDWNDEFVARPFHIAIPPQRDRKDVEVITEPEVTTEEPKND